MRVLVICDVLSPQTVGGAGRLAREVTVALGEKGNAVEFLTRQVPPYLSRNDANDIKTTYYPLLGKAYPTRFRQIFNDTIRDFKPDLVHIHQPLPAFLLIPSSFSRPIVYTFHSSWAEEFKIKSSRWPHIFRKIVSPLLAEVEKRVLHRATAITVLSEFSQRKLKQLYNRDGVIIPGGVNSERFQPIEEIESSQTLRLVTLRNLVPRMGLPQLIRAMKLLPSHIELTIGGQGPLRNELMRLIGSLGLSERVQLAGHVPDDDLSHFYSSANWFVLPTVALEGFGLVILESLSCGTPVLGTRIGAIPELLEKFDPQWIIKEPTPEAIAATILSVSENPPPSPNHLHDRVSAEFDWRHIAAHYLDLFVSLI
ncbi:MAG: glycosyltransferase family 4 protein [Acidobacteria bacterium]|nr:glycosyltransferase family 4 protein [Acidobacteriota bacterium]